MQLTALILLGSLSLFVGCQKAHSEDAQDKDARTSKDAPGFSSQGTAAQAAPKAGQSKAQEDKPTDSPLMPAGKAEPETPLPSPKRRYVVAALGDSITSATTGGGYLKVLREKCPQSEFLNFGKGADMVNQMRARFERDIRPISKSTGLTTLLVFGGVNDLYSDLTAGRTNDKIEADLTRIYSGAQKLNLEVVAITVAPWGGFSRYFNPRRGDNTRLLNSWILGQKAKGRITQAVDSYSLLSCGKEDQLCPEYETRNHDGIHPGAEGHRLLGEKIYADAFKDCL